MKRLYLLIACSSIGMQSMAQLRDTSNATPFTNHFFTGFMIRQSFQTPAQTLNPALLQITIPQTGRINWLFDAGLGVTLGKLSAGAFTSNLVAEFHRNTVVDSQQYNYQFGYNFVIQKKTSDGHTVPVFTGNLKYIRNVVDSGHSIAASLNIALYRPGKGRFNLGRPGFLSNYKYTYQLSPSFETQYQQVLVSDKETAGAIIRPMINLSAAFAINRKLTSKIMFPQKLVEVSFDYDNRYAVINAVHNGEGYTKLFSPRIAYYFFNTLKANAALAASYNLGSDPLNGLKDQRFWRFALQFQL